VTVCARVWRLRRLARYIRCICPRIGPLGRLRRWIGRFRGLTRCIGSARSRSRRLGWFLRHSGRICLNNRQLRRRRRRRLGHTTRISSRLRSSSRVDKNWTRKCRLDDCRLSHQCFRRVVKDRVVAEDEIAVETKHALSRSHGAKLLRDGERRPVVVPDRRAQVLRGESISRSVPVVLHERSGRLGDGYISKCEPGVDGRCVGPSWREGVGVAPRLASVCASRYVACKVCIVDCICVVASSRDGAHT
jgi:hypothetical protein